MTERPAWSEPPSQRVRTPPWAIAGKRDPRVLFPASQRGVPLATVDQAALEAPPRPPRKATPAEARPAVAAPPASVTSAPPAPPAPSPELLRAIEGLKQAASALEQERQRFRDAAPLEILDLALVVAREVLGAEPSTPARDRIEAALGEALQAFGGGPLTVRIHPNDADVVDELRRDRGDVGALELLLDPSLHRGDVVVEGALGRVDATRATRLHNIERKLRTVMGAGAHGGEP